MVLRRVLDGRVGGLGHGGLVRLRSEPVGNERDDEHQAAECDQDVAREGRVRAGSPPAVGVEEHAADRAAVQDGRTSRVVTVHLGVGLAARRLHHVNVDVVVGVDPGLLAGRHLLTGVPGDGCRIGGRKLGDLLASRLGEDDLLLGELLRHLVVGHGAREECDSTCDTEAEGNDETDGQEQPAKL